MNEHRGPGRPRRVLVEGQLVDAPVETQVTEETTEKPRKRRARTSVGGFQQKLGAPQREGYVRRFVNDVGNNIAEKENLAYDFVHDTGIQTDGPDGRVRRLVGTQQNGAPQYAYLMETPREEYDAGVADKEAYHRQVDEAIRAGRDATGRVENSYGEGSIKTG